MPIERNRELVEQPDDAHLERRISKPVLRGWSKRGFTAQFCDPARLIFKGQCYETGDSESNCSICGEVTHRCYILKILGDGSASCPPEVGKLLTGECCFQLIRDLNPGLYRMLAVARAYLQIVAKATKRDQRLYGDWTLARQTKCCGRRSAESHHESTQNEGRN